MSDPTFRFPVRHPSRPQAGFGYGESMLALTITGLAIALGAPSFQNWVMDSRLVTNINFLVADLHLVRSTAIKTNQPVSMCQSPGGRNCARSPQWEKGWIIFIDPNTNHRVDRDETVLRRRQLKNSNLGLRLRAFGSSRHLTYYPSGITRNRNGTFTFCDGRGPDRARAVILYKTGRVRTSHYHPSGDPLECPERGET